MSGGGSGGAVDGCGGHCVAFENFCYYCLQVRIVGAEDGGVCCFVVIWPDAVCVSQGGGTLLVAQSVETLR